ncbi:MAG: hypothetical protein ACI91O_000821 [Candidatus Poriferisodalaceae bacterium]|jgi:hypothetical protein
MADTVDNDAADGAAAGAAAHDEEDMRGFTGWVLLLVFGAIFTILAFLFLKIVDDDKGDDSVSAATRADASLISDL